MFYSLTQQAKQAATNSANGRADTRNGAAKLRTS
jgi:hypothetical protein